VWNSLWPSGVTVVLSRAARQLVPTARPKRLTEDGVGRLILISCRRMIVVLQDVEGSVVSWTMSGVCRLTSTRRG
jgi:hypothetical protein